MKPALPSFRSSRAKSVTAFPRWGFKGIVGSAFVMAAILIAFIWSNSMLESFDIATEEAACSQKKMETLAIGEQLVVASVAWRFDGYHQGRAEKGDAKYVMNR